MCVRNEKHRPEYLSLLPHFQIYSGAYFVSSKILRRTPDFFKTTSITLSTYHFRLTYWIYSWTYFS